jgi:hypothetical protein
MDPLLVSVVVGLFTFTAVCLSATVLAYLPAPTDGHDA